MTEWGMSKWRDAHKKDSRLKTAGVLSVRASLLYVPCWKGRSITLARRVLGRFKTPQTTKQVVNCRFYRQYFGVYFEDPSQGWGVLRGTTGSSPNLCVISCELVDRLFLAKTFGERGKRAD